MAAKQKHLFIINYAFQSDISSPLELLKRYFMLPGWANACVAAGAKVTVFQRFNQDHQSSIDGVDYVFIHDSLPPLPAHYHCAVKFNQKVKGFTESHDTTIHINGLIFPLCVLHLSRIINGNHRFVIQHHAEQPGRKLFRLLNQWANKRIDRFFFTTKFHAQPWIAAKALNEKKVAELMECSSALKPQNKSLARIKCRLVGQPLLLWTGNLDENKDPLTILAGFEKFLTRYPKAKLVMLFRYTELLNKVRQKISESEALNDAVSLIGEISYQQIGDYYNAADIFVQGSAREGSGIAVLDALACGAIPVISDIPSFAAMTENASVGQLWQRGESDKFVEALHNVMNKDLEQQQQQCISVYNRRWTFNALAKQAMGHYFD